MAFYHPRQPVPFGTPPPLFCWQLSLLSFNQDNEEGENKKVGREGFAP